MPDELAKPDEVNENENESFKLANRNFDEAKVEALNENQHEYLQLTSYIQILVIFNILISLDNISRLSTSFICLVPLFYTNANAINKRLF